MKGSLLTLLKIYGPILCFIILSAWVGDWAGFSMKQLVSDPAEISGQSSFIGFFSQIGNLLWCGTTAICLFSASIIRANKTKKTNPQLFAFLIFSGSLSALFLIDDQFRLHEKFGRILYGSNTTVSRTAQNVAEMIVFAVYGLVFVAFICIFRKLILRSNLLFLLLAVGFFGLSTIVDLTPENWIGHHIIEESCKLLGIFSWLIYFVQFCTQKIQALAIQSYPPS
jgi:hypothetical protein